MPRKSGGGLQHPSSKGGKRLGRRARKLATGKKGEKGSKYKQKQTRKAAEARRVDKPQAPRAEERKSSRENLHQTPPRSAEESLLVGVFNAVEQQRKSARAPENKD